VSALSAQIATELLHSYPYVTTSSQTLTYLLHGAESFLRS